MMTLHNTLALMRAFLLYLVCPVALLIYPMLVHAQPIPIVFGQGFLLIPALAWIAVWILSTLAGVAALLLRVSARLDMQEKGIEPVQRKNMLIFAAAHMFGSWVAGLLVFLGALHLNQPEWLVGVVILVASFAGAKFLEKGADLLYKKAEVLIK